MLLAAVLVAPIPRMSNAAEVCAPVLARVVSLQGTVEFRSSETEPWTAAALNDLLCADYWIRVGPSSRAGLALWNDSVLRVDQQSTMRFRVHADETRSLIDLFLGALYLFSHRPRALEVDTPFVNAATEGTEFLVSVGADQTRIIVFEGRILAKNPAGEVLLASGDAAVAAAGAAPRAQIVAQPRDAVAWTLYYPPILVALAAREPAARGLPPRLQTAVDRVAANDYPGALRALDTVPDAARDARFYAYRAGLLLNVGRVEQARAAIDQALALDPQAGEALGQRAIIALVQNQRGEALADARRAVELNPDSAAARIALSYAQQASFQLEAARATLREAVEVAPEDALAWARLSELELSFGELRAALEAANRAVALAPELSRTQTVLGFADLARFDVGGARSAFARAIALDSADPLPRLGLGLAMIRQSDLEQGRNEIEIAVALDPDNSLLRSYLGKAFFEEKRDQQAGEQYAIAKRLDPLDPTPWLYDAIRLQTENRPVEALRDLNRSIVLNDNRAVFRSSLLLDEDLATRQVSLARIYDDLGFEQVGLLEATRSLSLNPANYSAHRFLSDVYAALPRHEIARASELLQSQLLQPLNLNPVQPSLPFTDLNVVEGSSNSPANAFNDFTPAFVRDTAQLTATGAVGNNDTLGGEAVMTMLYDRVSLSAGGLLSETNGFRENNDVSNQLANAYGQVAVTPQFNVQAEYRHRDTNQGDLLLQFDPDDFSFSERRHIEDNAVRFGAHYQISPSSDVIGSVIYSDGSENLRDPDDEGLQITSDGHEKGVDAQGQYIFDSEYVNVVAGGGAADVDVDLDISLDFTDMIGIPCPPTAPFFGVCDFSPDRSLNQENAYAYTNVHGPANTEWTFGVSYDSIDQGPIHKDGFNPKLGVEWSPVTAVRFRMAYVMTRKRALIANQTLEPTQVAAFNQFFDDVDATKSQRYGIGVDLQPFSSVYVGSEVSRRDLDVPVTDLVTDDVSFEKEHEDFYRAYVYWTISPRWSARAETLYRKFDISDVFAVGQELPSKVDEVIVPLAVNFFHPNGFFAEVGGSYVHQNVKFDEGTETDKESDDVFLVKALAGFRLPKRLGIVSIEAINLLDAHFHFQDVNIQRQQPKQPRLIPDRTLLARLTFNF